MPGAKTSVLDERTSRLVERHAELGGHDRADQDRLSRAHRERQYAAGIAERQRLTEGLEPEAPHEIVVGADALVESFEVVVRPLKAASGTPSASM